VIVDWPAAGGCAVMAHRGGALVGPANSLATIRRSIDLGAHAVEVDIHELADSSLVLFHDRHVPTAAGPVPVADLDLPDLTHLAGAVDTVGDLLDCAAGAQVGLYLDVKDVSGAALLRLIDAVAAAGLTNRAVVGSFDRAVVEHVVADGRLEASVLYHDPTSDPLELAATLGCRIVHPCFDFLPHMVARFARDWMGPIHDAGLAAVGWNSNDPRLLAQMRAAGFDVLCTDDPRLAL
jgi:glycerophosphoryl diester phosphodiesterase